jgi:serralysin
MTANQGESVMATLTLGPIGQGSGTAFLYNFMTIATAHATFSVDNASQATVRPDPNQISNDVAIIFTGSNFDNPATGLVTGMSLTFDEQTEFEVTGLSLSSSDLEAAVEQSNPEVAIEQLAAILATVDWQIDFSAESAGSLIFGSGGNDTIALGSGDDFLMLDGGSDTSDAGAGNDYIYADAFFFGRASGFSTVTGGQGDDTFCLDMRELSGQDGPIDFFTKGQKVDLGKLVIFDETIFKLVGVENLRGSVFADQLAGTNAANKLQGEDGNDKLLGKGGIDTLVGGDGVDKLTGGAVADKLSGGKGDDDFVYTAVADSAKQHDIISDFRHKQDDIDLSKLHPDNDNDKFVFIGSKKFSREVGELQVIQHDNSGTKDDFTMVRGDLDGNGKADLQIELTGLVKLDAGDFLL